MRRQYLCDCTPGDMIEDVYVISGKQLAPTSTGKHYIKAFVSDRTSQVTARMWNATKEIFAALPDGGFARIRARIENYQNNLQCIIEQTWPAKEGSFDLGDLLPQTKKDVPTMCGRVVEVLGSVQNRHLAALLQAYLDDEKLMNDFCRAPAAMGMHHAYIGGLLEHTLNAMEVADAVVRFYPGLNRDLLIAGIFLHDIAKTWELTYECSFGYSDGGQLVGHIVKSVLWVEEKAKAAAAALGEPIPRPLIDVMQHIILSHHDKPEFGSPKAPATPEAIAVHMIENMDAKLMMALYATRGTGGPDKGETAGKAADGKADGKAFEGGKWTEYMKAFNGRLYRPDVAPAEAPVEEWPADESPARPPPAGGGANGSQWPAPAAAPVAPTPPDAPPDSIGRPVITNPLFASTGPKQK